MQASQSGDGGGRQRGGFLMPLPGSCVTFRDLEEALSLWRQLDVGVSDA